MSSSDSTLQPATASTWTVPYYVKGLALGVPTYLAAIHLWTWVFTLPVYVNGRADFRQFYAAGAIVRSGQAKHLYDYQVQKDFQDHLVSPEQVALPFVSPAYHAIFFAPFSFFSFRAAYFLFLIFNLGMLVVCFLLLRPWMVHLREIYPWLPLTILVGFLPIAAALIQGQDSILLLVSLVCTFVLLAKRRNFAAGILLGLGFFKFPITAPMALLYLAWRRWKFLLGFVSSAVVLASLSVFLVGIAQTKLYVECLFSIAGFIPPTTALAQYPVAWQMMADVHGFVFGIAGHWLSKSWLQAVTILLSAVIVGWTAWRGSRVQSDAANLFLPAILCAVLISHHTYIHDLSVLFLPTIVLLDSFLPREATGMRRERMIGRAAALMFVSPVDISFFPRHFYLVSVAVFLLLLAAIVAASTTDYLGLQSRPA
ncbi:MAG: DUF2029 domain-containing protein [Acidobacteria bacterium]|nr:DUF2029 domain-containing protein [Acidobacteriota bacterium]